MIEILLQYGLFLLKTVTIVVAIMLIIGMIASLTSRRREKGEEFLTVKKINQRYEKMENDLNQVILDNKAWKQYSKQQAKAHKDQDKGGDRPRLYVLDFNGDMKASAVNSLREEVSAVLTVARAQDEIFVKLESGGGMVHAYGLAASQLQRIRERKIPLTVSVDKIAASGGYMMASVADKIIAAPFAVIGSIGVIAQIPNFHRLLKKHDVDFEQITAGEFKRTLTMFGENSDTARAKFRQQVEETHALFKDFVSANRPQVDIQAVATGEHWYGSQSLQNKLVDQLITSDDYLMNKRHDAEIYEISYKQKRGLREQFSDKIQGLLNF